MFSVLFSTSVHLSILPTTSDKKLNYYWDSRALRPNRACSSLQCNSSK